MTQRVFKTDSTHKTITFVALVPDEVDLNNSSISADEIVKTAHDFMENLQEKVVNVDHKDDENFEKSQVSFVESYILPVEMTVGDWVIPAWTRMVGMKFHDDQLYLDVLSGEYVWISIEGFTLN